MAYHNFTMSVPSNATPGSPWPSPHSGWFSNGDEIIPYEGPPIPVSAITKGSVKLAMLLNAQALHDGFNVAFLDLDPTVIGTEQRDGRSRFPGKLLMNSSGQIYQFKENSECTEQHEDVYTYITTSLTSKSLALPSTGRFWNSWGIRHRMTCQANNLLYLQQASVASETEPKFKQITVYGYIMPPREGRGPLPLSREVEDYTTLPLELDELFGLVLEARGERGEEKNSDLIEAIKKVVRDNCQ